MPFVVVNLSVGIDRYQKY